MDKPIIVHLLPEAEKFVDRIEISARKSYSLQFGRLDHEFMEDGLRN